MTLPQTIKDLTSRFSQNLPSYSASAYNETQLRREFLDPFFDALGWDVANKQGYAEAYKEVIHEDSVKIGTATKAPDYSFRVGGTRKFFAEAKKPFINIKDDIDPAFQLRRYAWSAKLPLSILTDFQEFAVYDCRLKPVKTDKASIGRILYIKYDEYEERWDEIASIFSKDAILKGSFDKYAETTKSKKGTTEVDDAFLSEIEDWRDVLARNIAIRNEKLSPRELNFAVQRTIDRLIFLRICEDRGRQQKPDHLQGACRRIPPHLLNPSEESLRTKIVAFVTSMLDLQKRSSRTPSGQLNVILARQIEGTDRRIDELVYELYGLTEEEIKIVEGANEER
jgi:predicted type IV restriction endonuclease